jgi:hypothetical protein
MREGRETASGKEQRAKGKGQLSCLFYLFIKENNLIALLEHH